jgi:hypothetical protein
MIKRNIFTRGNKIRFFYESGTVTGQKGIVLLCA